jgi:hypothetical protein
MRAKRDLKRLEAVLDAFGPDAARWPDAERRELFELIDRDAEAGRLMAEAEALARVMASAPSLTASQALKARILEGARPNGSTAVPSRPIAGALQAIWKSWGPFAPAVPTAGLMAASLAFGLYIGAMGLAQPVFEGALDYAQVDGGLEEDVSLFEAPDGSDYGLEALL